MEPKRIKILFIITGLGVGGAEYALQRLLANLSRDIFETAVLSLGGDGPLGDKIRELNVPVYWLGLDARRPNPFLLFKLIGIIRRLRPTLIQTWMYHANLVGGLAGKLGKIPVIWAIRHSSSRPETTSKSTLLIMRVCAFLSAWIPVRILSVSKKARQIHVALGYAPEHFLVIPNGFDLDHFHPDPEAAEKLRMQLDLPAGTPLIGMAARFDPQKDHSNFVRAAQILHQGAPQTHFLLCGSGLTWENTQLADLINAAGLRDLIHLLGRRDDMPFILAGLDLHTLSSSYGEAFPNVIGEAMACGVPCVVTDVGDAAEIVADTGLVVDPNDSEALARAWQALLALPVTERHKLGERARQRIQSEYRIEAVSRQYQELYLDVATSTNVLFKTDAVA